MKILFISHDASRTGAPILLLRLIEQIKIYSDFEILILLKNCGELKEDFERLGKTFVWNAFVGEDDLLEITKVLVYKRFNKQRINRKERHKSRF